MSSTLMAEAFTGGPTDPAQRLAVVILADGCDDNGYGVLGPDWRIAAKLAIEESQVSAALNALVDSGWLELGVEFPDGRTGPRCYKLNAGRIRERAR